MSGYDGVTRFFLWIVYFCETLIAFFVMLIMMTLNGYIMFSTLMGLTLGYGLLKMKADFNGAMNFIEKEDYKNQGGSADHPHIVQR